MDRRTFNKLIGLATMGALTADVDLSVAQAAAVAGELVLEDSELLVAFDRASGALTRMEYKPTGWTIERRPALGVSFRLLAPLPGRRDNFVLGQKQRAVSVKKISDHEVQLRWENLVSEHGGVLPMTLTAIVTLTNGKLTFNATLENHSHLMVETIDYPHFGDINPPTQNTPMAARTMWYGNLGSNEIYPKFGNEKGYWGVDFPTKTFGSNRSLFCLIQSPRQGLYVEMSDPTLPYYLEYTFEQHPGVLYDSVVPKTDEISGFPVHLKFRTCHFIFAHPNSAVKLAPVVLRGYQGDWHAGVDVYRQWRATWFKPAHLPDWAKEVHSWTMLRMNTPEEDYSIPYTEFLEYGKEYASNGVRAVQLVGWNKGGQDRDDPSMDIEPHLGTWQQFHDTIAKVQAMGVKVILFGKLNWADMTTAWYKNELYKYQATDPYGIPYQTAGYSYVTPTQLAGINNRRRAVMDFLDPTYRTIATQQFEKILALGAEGWLWDEVCHHGPVLYNFAPGHGYVPPDYIYHGDQPLSARLRAVANKVNPNFIFAGEGPQDWLMQYFPVSETGVGATPICQYLDPNCLLLAGVSGFDDREKLNMILLHRYVIQYEPFYYKGNLRDFPLTLAYGKKIDALRRKYKAYLWDGEFRDTLGADVTANGPFRYSVFVVTGGRRAVIVINPAADKAITAKVNLPNAGELIIATPEQPDGESTTGTLQIPARSAAVVIEQ
ncbi:MAG: DUF6259 domain-containing protein [Acidobacteriaceae bacterium]